MVAQPIETGDYTIEQLADAARKAGFTGDDLITAISVSLAENTGRRLNARNTSAIEDSYGPWQINYLAWRDYGPLFDPANLQTLEGSARAAKFIHDLEGGFTAWSVYLNGAYKQFEFIVKVLAGQNDIVGINVPDPTANLPHIPDPVDSLKDALSTAFDVFKLPVELLVKVLTWFTQERHYWQIAFVLAGLAMTGVGFAVFFRNEIEQTAQIAGKVAAV